MIFQKLAKFDLKANFWSFGLIFQTPFRRCLNRVEWKPEHFHKILVFFKFRKYFTFFYHFWPLGWIFWPLRRWPNRGEWNLIKFMIFSNLAPRPIFDLWVDFSDPLRRWPNGEEYEHDFFHIFFHFARLPSEGLKKT